MTPMARSIVLGIAVGSVVGLTAMVVLAFVQAPEGWEGVVVLVYGMIGLVVGSLVGTLVGWLSGRRRSTA